MDQASVEDIVQALSSRQPPIQFDRGLTDEETEGIEQRWGFAFPPDLRRFLQAVLPVTTPFVDWRGASAEHLRDVMEAPADGLLFDVEHGGFWMAEWGARPSDLEPAIRVARNEIAKAPRLIPLYSHRYLPSEPSKEGNPVISVMQSDAIYYGENLADWFRKEFWTSFGLGGPTFPQHVRRIRFWSDLIELD